MSRWSTPKREALFAEARQKDFEAQAHFAAGRDAAGLKATREASELRKQAIALPNPAIASATAKRI